MHHGQTGIQVEQSNKMSHKQIVPAFITRSLIINRSKDKARNFCSNPAHTQPHTHSSFSRPKPNAAFAGFFRPCSTSPSIAPLSSFSSFSCNFFCPSASAASASPAA